MLEDRALLSPDPLTVDAILIKESGVNSIGTTPLVEAFQFSDGARWSTTFTNGSGLTQGDPTTLRWGIVTDGTFISSGFGELAGGSSLIQFMDSLYGDNGVADNGDLTQKPWFTIFSSSFNRLAQISGLTYTYFAINSQSTGFVSIADGSTSSATVPEILIGGHSIDGQSGSNTLAYNYFPSTGDMVIDTDNTSFFSGTLGTRNVLMHEAGHGVGFNHVDSSDGAFLMEPFISTAFDGPQFDDILAFQRGYGDILEKSGGNNTFGTATSLGAIGSGNSVSKGTSAGSSTVIAAAATDFTSIDDDSDVDFFSFSVASSGTTTLTLTPKGPTYQQGPQNGTESSFNAAAQNDLTLQLLSTNGTTVLQTANVNGLGGTETIASAALSAPGTYFARVSGANNDVQLYRLDVTFSAASTTISANGSGGNGAGNGMADTFRLVRNGANLEVYLGNNLSQTLTFASITNLTVQGSSDNDTLTLDFSGGDVMPSGGIVYTGGTGNNSLIASGAGNVATGSYTPSSTTNGSGTLTLGGKSLAFSGLTPLIVSGITDFTFTTPNGDDSLTIDSPGAGQNRISGTSGGVGFGALTFSTIPNFTLNASANDDGTPSDSVTLNASGLVATGLVSFSLMSGAGGSGITLNGPVSLSGNLSVTSGTITANSTIATSGSGAVTLTANGGASLNVNNTITSSSGAITLSAAGNVILAANGDVTSTSGLVTVTADNDGNASGTIYSLADVNHGSAGSTWSLADNDGTMSGVIRGSGGFTKIGAGTLTLAGTSANTFSGSTTVSAGRLNVHGSLASGSTVTVQNTATLGGSGTVAGAVNVQSGGKVAPGTSPGILNTGSISFSSGSTFQVEIGGTTAGNAITNHDQLNVTGTVSLGNATLTTLAFNSFVPVVGNKFTILVNDGSDLITGTFKGLAEGATISNFLGSGFDATITYVANTDAGSVGNDVVLTVVNTAATPMLSISDVMVAEGHSGTTTFTFNVTLSAATAASFRVPFQTMDGSATTANNDYVPLSSSGGLKIGAFNGTRGGVYSLADGANAAGMRTQIQNNFPGASIVGTTTLTSTFLATVNVVWLNSVSSDTSATSALSAAEQSALQNFVSAGGGAVLFGENGAFDDSTLLSPFGLTTTGTSVGVTSGTITNMTHPLTHGPFGDVATLSSNYPGNLTGLGGATSLGTWNSTNQSALAVLTSGRGKVVALSDVNVYADRLAAADNSKLLLNTLAFMQPATELQFAGTAGETHQIQVLVNGDRVVEPNEVFSVLLGTVTGTNDVTVSDGIGMGTILNDDFAPVVNDQSFSIDENSATNTVVGTVLASDANVGDVLTYSIVGGNTGNAFKVNTSTGQLSVMNSGALDFETTPTFHLTVQVQDAGGNSDTADIKVTLNDVSESGLAQLTINDVSHFEGNSGTTSFTFTVTLSAATAASFRVPFQTQDGTAMISNNDYVPLNSSNGLVIGAFDATRGGTFGLANTAGGASSAAMRAEILNAFPGATIVGFGVDGLTPAFLSTVSLVWLNSVSSDTSSTAPLSAAEQTALQNFVNAGGGAILFGESSAFDDTSLLSPFGLSTTGATVGITSGTITNPTHPLTHGPFGDVTTLSSNYPGNLTGLGSATSLGTWNSSNQSALAVLNYGTGKVVALTDVNLYADRLNQPGSQNRALLLNAIAYVQPIGDLQFAGTAGETHTIQVLVNGDLTSEADEVFSVLLGGVIGTSDVTITDGTGTGTIQNDDATPVAPVVNDQSFSINENSANNSVVGTVIATDPGDVLTYSILSGNTGGAFQINSSTGQVTVLNSAALDYETTPMNKFDLTVKVQDAGGLSDTAVITISLNDVQATLSINDRSQAEGNSGTTPMTFTVTLSSAAGASFHVPFHTADGTAPTATANTDYLSLNSSGSLVIGAFNAARGGTFGLANSASGASAETMRAEILNAFPGATIVGVGVGGLTSAFLSTVNVVWLNSVSGNASSTSPLSAAEQTALQNFVNAGGGAILFGENDAFDDSTLLTPFGLETTGSTTGVTSGMITNTTHPLTHGPFGDVTTLSSNFPGNLTGLGSATSLGTWNSSGLSALAVLNYGAGKVVALTDVNLYSDRLNQPGNQNRALLLNALAFTQPAGDLQFVGTAGEMHTIQVTINGDGLFEPDENFNVLLTSIIGSNDVTILDGSGAGTIVNDDAMGVLQISDALVSERAGQSNNAVFHVTLSSPSKQPVTVNFSTANISSSVLATVSGQLATAGKDFQGRTGTLRFAPGQLSQTISIPILDDTLHESDEAFLLQLSSPTGATIRDGVGQATIRDNDAVPKLTINDVTVTEKTNATVNAAFTVKLSAASAVPVTVDFSTAADSATAGADYQSSRGTITFNPGETTKTITVVTNDDQLYEASEVFYVNLTNSIQAAILVGQGKGTIKDNDKAPSLSINDVRVIEGATAVYTVSLSAPSGQAVTVSYATANGSATAGREYAATSGTLTFAAGETTTTIRVAITPNAIAKSSKSFNVNLSRAVNALFADSQALATILNSGN